MASEATTAAEIVSLVTDPHVEVSYGADLLDEDDVYLADISDDFKGGTVDWDNDALVHGHATFRIAENADTGDLLLGNDWEDVRIRPWQKLTSADYYATWYLGVYVLTEPTYTLGSEAPLVYEVEGYTKECLADRPTGDSLIFNASGDGKWLDGAEWALTFNSDGDDETLGPNITGAGVAFDPTSATDNISVGGTSAAFWLYDFDNPTSWLQVCNDCLEAVGYNKLYTTLESGLFTSEPYVSPDNRPSMWTFDLSDEDTQLVYSDREYIRDKRDRTNWIRFCRRNMQVEPTEGAGYYTTAFNGGVHTIGGTKALYTNADATEGLDYYHDFTSNGTFSVRGGPLYDVSVELVGAGGGGASAGGGAGEYVLVEHLTLTEGDYSVVIGTGGAAGTAIAPGSDGSSGGDTTFNNFTALGGGGAARADNNGNSGGSGGGGGASSGATTTGGASTASDGVGYAGGGNAGRTGSPYPSGGGGGASAVGDDAPAADTSGSGGAGVNSSLIPAPVTPTQFCGGGGGACYVTGNNPGAATHGGGSGSSTGNGGAGTANTGGGGGGGVANFSGGAGGSGRLVIRYNVPVQYKQTVMTEAVDQTTLESMAAAHVEKLQGKNQLVRIQTGPWPVAGHKDIVKLVDADADIDSKCAVRSWSIPLDGHSPVELELQVLD